jgi:hypothetical protein
VWGFEDTLVGGVEVVNIYLNGIFQGSTGPATVGFSSALTPRALIMGWNPGTTTAAPAPNDMLVDYVRVWKKS